MVLLAWYFFSCKSENQSDLMVQNRKNKNTARELLQLEQIKINAINSLDTNRLKEIIAPDFQLTTVYGEIKNVKDLFKDLVAHYQKGATEHHYVKSPRVVFFNKEKTAIIRGLYSIEKHEKNGVVVLNARYTDIYIKINGLWMLVSSHVSRLKRPDVNF